MPRSEILLITLEKTTSQKQLMKITLLSQIRSFYMILKEIIKHRKKWSPIIKERRFNKINGVESPTSIIPMLTLIPIL